MYPSSSRFQLACIDSHVMATKCEVRDFSGTLLTTFNAMDGDITVDEDSQSPRRVCDLTIPIDRTSYIVDSLGDLFAPDTNELWLYRGVEFPDGTTEVINLGVFVISDYVLDDSGAGFQVRLTGKDRVWRLQRSPFTDDIQFVSGTSYIGAIQQIVSTVIPGQTFIVPTLTNTMGLTVFQTGDDRWKAIQELAAPIGCQPYFDVYGNFVLWQIPDFTQQPSLWSFNADDPANSTVLYVNKRETDDGFFNHIIVLGNAPENQTAVRGEALDNNPASPTSIYSRYGELVRVIKDSSIKDVGTAAARAAGELNKGLGLTELIYFSCIVFPVFELGDVFTLKRAKSGISAKYDVQKLAIPMTNDRPMYITCGKRVVV